MKQFDRLKKIISADDFKKIRSKKILIVGLGGVGGYALETLVRSGIKDFTLVDNDVIEETNLNRQIISLHDNIGKSKTEVAKTRALAINPKVQITCYQDFILDTNIDIIFKKKYDYIVDACDTINTKVALVQKAKEKDIKIISSMGTGNKLDPTKLEITDLKKTNYDPVAKLMRKFLKNLKIDDNVTVISSTEKPIKTTGRIVGSLATVPATAGIYCASYILNDILKEK